MSEPSASAKPEQSANQAAAHQAGANRLLSALNTAPPERRTCNRIRQAFPEMAEAELHGERIGQRFPVEVAHLDRCEACSLEYGDLLDALLALEETVVMAPQAPAPMLPAYMATALRIRRWVAVTARQILQKTLRQAGDVELQLATWLEELAAAPLNTTLPSQQQMALAYGGDDDELRLILATWSTAQVLAEQYSVEELRALQTGGKLADRVRAIAEGIASQLPLKQRRSFVDIVVEQALSDQAAVIELGRPQ
ncbi:MAG: hypothetical protein IAE81_21665 [Caldilineaceae bacterium]|jgi:hypothetical protein|nr:hypothetical protein [Caldilineaceae bacterium]